ncbi:MAG: sodium-dependent transporter [Bernardetiaceae bacterium]|nr:sodium-dependent transporter [Bernardetiaceae bacterium]
MSTNTESWGSRVGLILAMAGNAVGLGNFLRFPAQAIQNGGGAFIIPYLVCFLLMGVPLMLVEWSMGRFGGQHGHHSTPFILDTMHKGRFWKYIGVFGIFTNLAVAAYYCYLESWTLAYVWKSISGAFNGLDQAQVSSIFGSYVSLSDPANPGQSSAVPIVFWLICLAMNTYILSRGLSGGVETAAKIGMPLLIVFGIFLAIKGVTITAGESGAIKDGSAGLNYLWTPDFSSIWKPSVWLAAAGQIFFTLSVGMGTIQCYASYLRANDDVALNAMSAGWMNEFVEVVLGGAILIPVAVGYFGIDGMMDLMRQGGGLGLGFRTLPYLFEQWGDILGVVAGVFWFGLLFFAGITSSLAMGTPFMGFMQDEFGWKRETAALGFGVSTLLLGAPTVFFFQYGVFDEYDYWAGTFSLVVFAFVEIILFAWVFGMTKGWAEITRGADIKIPLLFKYIIQYVTPLLLGWVFFASLPDVWKKITNEEIYAQIAAATDPAVITGLQEKIVYVNASRGLLLAVFLGIAFLVRVAYLKRMREGRV